MDACPVQGSMLSGQQLGVTFPHALSELQHNHSDLQLTACLHAFTCSLPVQLKL